MGGSVHVHISQLPLHTYTHTRYMSKWVSSYEKSGIPIWAITVQNEPEFAAPWEACSFNTSTQLAFVSNFLGPTFRKDHSTVKILGFDHNKDHAVHWARELGDAGGNLDGIGYHWYAGGMDRLLDGGVGGPNMHRLREETTGLVLGTEGCHCPSTGYAGGELEVAWKRAERNAHAILADLGAGSAGSIEWNLILDKLGGPNHLGNVCDGPIVAIPVVPGYPVAAQTAARSEAGINVWVSTPCGTTERTCGT